MTSITMHTLHERLNVVRRKIDAACDKIGRDAAEVTLVAVSKTVGREQVDLAYEAGIRNFGENRVQAAIQKFAPPMPGDTRLHMIGHLQSNKARSAVEMFDMIQSVDRLSLIQELQRQAARREISVDVLLQVNVAGESQKAGCDPLNAPRLAQMIAQVPELNLLGLMTMAPLVDDPEFVRPVFRDLASLRESLSASSAVGALPILSMGMTDDFPIAIEEGATHVRIGRAIFGLDE